MGIQKKANALLDALNRNGLLQKVAADQKIEHISSPEDQASFGKKQQKEIEQGCEAQYASAAGAPSIEGMKEPVSNDLRPEGPEDKPSEAVLSATGTTVEKMDPNGDAQGTPAAVGDDLNKSAALHRRLNACIQAEMNKQAAYDQVAMQKTAAENFITGTEVMNKIASLANAKTAEEAAKLEQDVEVSFNKLAAYNPMFGPAAERVAMRKMAEEIDALAEAEGISPEEAAGALDASMEQDPAAQEEFNNEVEGEAISDLAGAEQATGELMQGLDGLAQQFNEATGAQISAEDIISAAEDVVAQADEMGVEPEALIQAAAEQMASADGGEGITPEDEAQAEELLAAAAEQGISPEEVIQAVAEEAGAGEAALEAAPAEEAPAEEGQTKEAAYHQETLTKLASTKRGANLAMLLSQRG